MARDAGRAGSVPGDGVRHRARDGVQLRPTPGGHDVADPVPVRRVPEAVAVGESLVVRVQARDRWGLELHEAGIPVALSQVVFSPEGSSRAPRRSTVSPPAAARSPRAPGPTGSAVFTVVGTAPLRDPLYPQAWIASDAADPHSFSGYLSLRFSPTTGARP